MWRQQVRSFRWTPLSPGLTADPMTSDLFGRRYFILFGNILVFVGAVLGATSHSMNQSIAAHTLIGFGAGNCQLAAFALPELLPNKWRHFAVVIADGLIFFTVIVGPVTARIAILHGDAVCTQSPYVKPRHELTKLLVEMGILDNLHCHRNLLRYSRGLLSSTQASSVSMKTSEAWTFD